MTLSTETSLIALKKQVLREVTEITVIDCHHPPNS
nr:MAG TPA: hypothetical protein [Caudoviricetes sp.]